MNASEVIDICHPQLTAEQQDQYEANESKRLYIEYRALYGLLPLPLALPALIATVLFAFSVEHAINARRVSRKCYILILNRAAGDVLCSAFFILLSIYLYATNAESFDFYVLMTLGSLCIGFFWSAMVSYVGLSVMKLYVVWKPLHCRTIFTMKRCVCIIAFSWMFYAVLVAITLLLILMRRLSALRKWFGISTYEYQLIFTLSQLKQLLFVAMYAFTLVMFFLTLVFVYRSQRWVRSIREAGGQGSFSSRRSRFPLWKLGFCIATFAIMNSVYVFETLYWMTVDLCTYKRYVDKRLFFRAILRCVMLLRILIDSVSGIFIDPQIRRSLESLIGVRSYMESSGIGPPAPSSDTSLSVDNFECCLRRSQSCNRRGSSVSTSDRPPTL